MSFAVRITRTGRSTRGVLFLRDVPPDLKTAFKTTCTRRGDSMKSVIEALMRLYVHKPDRVRVRVRK